MKKSDQKKRDREVKNADRRKKHAVGVLKAEHRREEKASYEYQKKHSRIAHTADRDARDERIMEQLQKNLEILKKLEEEYDREQAAKQQLNAELEAKGLHTLEEKMEHLQSQVGGHFDPKEPIPAGFEVPQPPEPIFEEGHAGFAPTKSEIESLKSAEELYQMSRRRSRTTEQS